MSSQLGRHAERTDLKGSGGAYPVVRSSGLLCSAHGGFLRTAYSPPVSISRLIAYTSLQQPIYLSQFRPRSKSVRKMFMSLEMSMLW